MRTWDLGVTAMLCQTMRCSYLIKTVPKFITMATVGPAQSTVLPQYQEPTIYTTPEHLVPLMYFLRDHVNTQFKCLLDVTAVDYPERKTRFEVVYHLLSPKWNNRIRVKVRTVSMRQGHTEQRPRFERVTSKPACFGEWGIWGS